MLLRPLQLVQGGKRAVGSSDPGRGRLGRADGRSRALADACSATWRLAGVTGQSRPTASKLSGTKQMRAAQPHRATPSASPQPVVQLSEL